MGTKFANIQLQTKDIAGVKKKLKDIKRKNSVPKFDTSKLKDEKVSRFLTSILNSISPDTYYIGQFNEWVTVLNNKFTWETVGNEALMLSKEFECPILAIGYFDDDLLEIALIKNQEIITLYRQGELGCYELEESKINIDVLCEILGVWDKKEKIKEAFETLDTEAIVDNLEKIFNTPIWIDGDWLEEEDEDVKDQFIKI